ncbi:hypothetical protein [Goodfellowiella coeruleoviolacea]|uniref:Secreted protein n=1 Tax=Goodfellowiella coeruleoviolacea TaxID=334858 RepID=A0AAE3GGU4_9PSEU|nr:hypothetical protein [Goodfellowiella coeruleoviolacea]MCP2167100.1 hypothetical protein [Goodfellowiella coeruleoviolacea]
MSLKRLFVFAGLIAMVLTTGVSVASASPRVSPEFATQGRVAGLTATQINTLQAEVNEYLAELGGKQTALNRIELDGATIRVALPGEAQPRRLAHETLDANCDGGYADYHHFCTYRNEYYTGTHIDMYACGVYDIPESWVGPGSWDNNQTAGTKACMMNDAGSVIFTTKPARSYDPTGNWNPVDRMRNC